MDYGGVDRRKTKGDLKRKRIARGYKRGGKFRTSEVSPEEAGSRGQESGNGRDKMGKVLRKKKR